MRNRLHVGGGLGRASSQNMTGISAVEFKDALIIISLLKAGGYYILCQKFDSEILSSRTPSMRIGPR